MTKTSLDNCVVVCAAPRTGTTVLQLTLQKDPRFRTYLEVFHDNKGSDRHKFFNFVQSAPQLSSLYLFPTYENMRGLFDSFFRTLKEEAERPIFLVDIKYSSMHHFNSIWYDGVAEPNTLTFLKERGARFVHLRRRNLFRQVVSEVLATRTRQWHVRENEREISDVDLDLEQVEARMREIDINNDRFAAYLEPYRYVERLFYEDMFDDGFLSEAVFSAIARLTGETRIGRHPLALEKLLVGVGKSIVNAEAVLAHFRGSPFEEHVVETLVEHPDL